MALLLQPASQSLHLQLGGESSFLGISSMKWPSSMRGNAAQRHRDDAAVEDLARTCAQPGASDLQCCAVAMLAGKFPATKCD